MIIILSLTVIILSLLFRIRVRRAEQRGMTEPITGGINSAALDRHAAKYLSAKGNCYCVITMELSNYRQLLQTFGTEESNKVLKHLHKTLKNALSNVEPVARIDGGSFCFLMKNQQPEAIRARLMRISESANDFNQTEQLPYRLELRYGIYIPEKNGESIAEIREKIWELMEDNSEEFSFYRVEQANIAARNWEQLRQIDKSFRNGDFVVYMQPKVRLSDNRITGGEALIRWKHPQQGLLTPEMFIPLLEDYHLISRFDLYLFEQVCRQMEIWSKEGKVVCPISLNLSHETIKQKNFMEPYVKIVKQYGVAPKLIEFELSRRLQEQNIEDIGAVVRAIHSHGFRCALDRFGGSKVQLHLLRELDVDTVKLDHSFFIAENNTRRNRYVVEAIIKIASQMQIRTVAEGIDNASQVQYLKQAGCDMVQGFYFFQPMSIEEFSNAVYSKEELRYVSEEGKPDKTENVSSAPNASGNIIMFSMLTESDKMTFSSCFSPVLEGQRVVHNAISLLCHSELIHENDRKDFLHLLERCLKKNENNWVEDSIRFYTAKGRYEWMEVHMHKEYIHAAGETVISGTMINTAGWTNELDRWKEKANRDALTGLYNREYFEQYANIAIKKEQNKSAAVVFVDIDDFKNVNDTLGHSVGDDVIRWFAKRVQGAFRHSDIVARYGGDEFVVFVNDTEKEDLVECLQQLCESFRYPYKNGDIEYPVSGSIGAAVFPEDGKAYQELLNHADSALYEAKRKGKNRFMLYYSGMEETEQQ